MELERLVKLDELVINHEDVTYLNSKAAKEFITDFKKVRQNTILPARLIILFL